MSDEDLPSRRAKQLKVMDEPSGDSPDHIVDPVVRIRSHPQLFEHVEEFEAKQPRLLICQLGDSLDPRFVRDELRNCRVPGIRTSNDDRIHPLSECQQATADGIADAPALHPARSEFTGADHVIHAARLSMPVRLRQGLLTSLWIGTGRPHRHGVRVGGLSTVHNVRVMDGSALA